MPIEAVPAHVCVEYPAAVEHVLLVEEDLEELVRQVVVGLNVGPVCSGIKLGFSFRFEPRLTQ